MSTATTTTMPRAALRAVGLDPLTPYHLIAGDASSIGDAIEALSSATAALSLDDDGGCGQPFRFFDLPAELRLRILDFVLVHPKTVDLDPTNGIRLAPRLVLFLVSRRMHAEASAHFYAANTFRLFPTHYNHFGARDPLLSRLPATYRAHITSIELRLGPGFNNLPASWRISRRLGLGHCRSLRRVSVFVECDPQAHVCFRGLQAYDGSFTRTCERLLAGLLRSVPTIEEVRFDAFPSVSKDSPLVMALLAQAREHGKTVSWGPERGWGRERGREEDGALVKEMEKLALW